MVLKISLTPLMLGTTAASFLLARFTTFSVSSVLQAYPAALAFYIVFWAYVYPFYLSPLRVIPTVPGNALWGHVFTLYKYEAGYPQRLWHQQYGPVVRYFFPLGGEKITIADDAAIKQMTIKNPYNYPKRKYARQWMSRVLGLGVLLAEGEEHVHQRKALTPGFSIASIKDLAPIFWSKALLLSKLWQREVDDTKGHTKTYEVLEWLNRTTLDIIGQAGFGADFNSLEHPETPIRQAYILVFAFDFAATIIHGLQLFLPFIDLLPVKTNRDIQKSRSIILKKATEIITEKRDQVNAADKDILSLMVRDDLKMKQAGEGEMSFETMRDQVMTFLGAGHDTTATGVAWTLHLLAKHQDVQARLRTEIKEYFPFLWDPVARNNPEQLKTIDVDQLPYLDRVCRESLRYIPPIPMTARQAAEDDNLGGYHIPAGTVVYVMANAINHLPQYWGPTAGQFDPERWEHLPDTYTTNAFMTFLQGPRGCIGRKFAETEMKTLLCCLLSLFQFDRDERWDDPEKVKVWRLVLRPKDGIHLKVRPIGEVVA